MSNSIKSKINSAIRQRLNKILLIKRHFSPKSKRSRTSPLFQPVDGVDKFIVQGLVVAFEVFLDVVQHSFLPVFIGVIEIPLVATFYHAYVTCTGEDVTVGFVVYHC